MARQGVLTFSESMSMSIKQFLYWAGLEEGFVRMEIEASKGGVRPTTTSQSDQLGDINPSFT